MTQILWVTLVMSIEKMATEQYRKFMESETEGHWDWTCCYWTTRVQHALQVFYCSGTDMTLLQRKGRRLRNKQPVLKSCHEKVDNVCTMGRCKAIPPSSPYLRETYEFKLNWVQFIRLSCTTGLNFKLLSLEGSELCSLTWQRVRGVCHMDKTACSSWMQKMHLQMAIISKWKLCMERMCRWQQCSMLGYTCSLW